MRLMPKTIVARTAWVMGLWFILMMVDAALIVTFVTHSEDRSDSFLVSAVEVKTMTSIVSRTNADERPALLQKMAGGQWQLKWKRERPENMTANDNWQLTGLKTHIEKYVKDLSIRDVVITHPRHDFPADNEELMHYMIDVQLEDGSWLTFESHQSHQHKKWLMSLVVLVLVFVLSIYVLARLVSRQVLKPLRQFSQAAHSFSTDINAAPIQEQGAEEIRQAAVVFNTMQRRIQQFVDERMKMLAAISHDLRTPLTRIRLRLEKISDSEQQQKCLTDVAEMQDMLDMTLSFARDEAQQEQKTQVDLPSLLQSIADDMSDMGQDVNYSGPTQLSYECRPLAMRRAFSNLIDNACKYGGQAEIALQQDSPALTITIHDQGPGIPSQEQEKIFAPFYRLEQSRSRETGGAGLGLAVTKTIVQSHGGDIELVNRPSGGLDVIVRFPLQDL